VTAADIAAVFALERSTHEAPHWPRRDYEAILTGHPAAEPLTRTGLIAEIDGHLAGFAIVRQLRFLSLADNPVKQVQFELESIVVAAALRARGIGLSLMSAILDLATSNNADRLELEVRTSNQPAIRLYTRAGLTPQGRRPNYYSNPPDDALLMAKDLSPVKQP
jgi:ribosomal-protein-alanine N-acetyltransferase